MNSSNLENKTPSDSIDELSYEFFRTTIGIQSRPDAFDKSRFIMTFLTILGVTDILCSFSLVLEGKTGKKLPDSSKLEFLEKFSAICTTPLVC